MNRDLFIINVYCLVAEHLALLKKQYHLQRGGGFAPALTDAEVITIEICGEYFKLNHDKDIYKYFAAHYRHFFPALPSRTTFVRQAANLWQWKDWLQLYLVQVSGQAADPCQSIDTLPLPVCTYTRAPRDRRFRTLADYGHCAAKKLDYYGFKLGLRIARCGMITHHPLLSARRHDVQHLGTLIAGFNGLVPADKGFIDEYQQQLWAAQQGVQVLPPARAKMQPVTEAALVRASRKWRKLVETVNSQLTERFQITQVRVRDFAHYQHRLVRKILAHTVCVFLNLKLGRAPLDFDGLEPI